MPQKVGVQERERVWWVGGWELVGRCRLGPPMSLWKEEEGGCGSGKRVGEAQVLAMRGPSALKDRPCTHRHSGELKKAFREGHV